MSTVSLPSSAPSPPEESRYDDSEVGRQIRELRRVKGMSLQQLADTVGVSVGYLSQVERNRSKLPLATLRQICDALRIHISWFFHATATDASPEREFVVRKIHRRRMSFTATGLHEELLSPNLSGPLELLMSTWEPGADSGELVHEGAEAGVVLSGKLELYVNGDCFALEAGDSFSFKSTDRHRTRNPTEQPTTAVWVVTPPYF